MPRKLTQEEKRLWRKVARTVTPRREREMESLFKLDPETRHMMRLPPTRPKPPAKRQSTVQINLDKKTRRGRLAIDARIDLHDLTRDQAFGMLKSRLRELSEADKRCVLIITGKGPRLMGVIRQAFPDWINHPDIRPHVASYAPASQKHGGSGAWYVFLKKTNH